jgi:hypothetical protein
VYVPKVVIAKLIQGAMTEKEIAVIEDFVNALLVIDQTADIQINLRGDIRLVYKLEQFDLAGRHIGPWDDFNAELQGIASTMVIREN